MSRYVKVNNKWIDTLIELKENHIAYIVIDGYVIAICEDGSEDTVGRLEEESDYERVPL